jgi:UPF0755 protein
VTDTPSIDDERHLDDDRPVDDRDADDGDWDDYVEVRRETTRGRKVLYLVAAVLAFVLVVGAGTAFWIRGQIDPGSPGDEVAFTVPEGATTTDVANLLEEEGIITNSAIFGYYVRYKGAGPFQAGDYDGLRENSAMGDVITRLEAGPIPPVFATFTIPPGLRLEEVKAAILTNVPGTDAAELDAALAQATSPFLPAGTTNLEGFLFPETYQIEEEEGAADEVALVNRLIGQFDAVATELGYDQPNQWGLTPYELVIIASLIEEETRVPEEQAMVSRVIHNRLADGMTLGIDATLLYEVGHTDSLTQSQLDTPSPYNTRLNTGLPPTPIAMPGRGALDAALNPAEGDWLYYVLADTEGHHFFTADYDEFLAQKEKSQAEGIF